MTGKSKIEISRFLPLVSADIGANIIEKIGWLQVMQLSSPRVHVVAEDVEKGKPDPACYALGIQRLGLESAKKEAVILVIEGPFLPYLSPNPHPRSRLSGRIADAPRQTHLQVYELARPRGARWSG